MLVLQWLTRQDSEPSRTFLFVDTQHCAICTSLKQQSIQGDPSGRNLISSQDSQILRFGGLRWISGDFRDYCQEIPGSFLNISEVEDISEG